MNHETEPAAARASNRPVPGGREGTAGREHEAELSAYLQSFVARNGSTFHHVLRRPAETFRAGRDLLALPVLTVTVGRSAEGAAIRHEFSRFTTRRWLLGLSAVLEIPQDPEQYRAGSSKQTLRRKARAAQAKGVTWRPINDVDERRHLLELANLHELMNEREQYRQEQPENDDLLDHRLWLLASSADGVPLLLSVTPYDGEWASLRYFRTLSSEPAASDARYWMTDVLVEHLSALGVRHLIDAAVPHWLPNGLRHFQRMVGFRLVRLRFPREP